MRLWLTNHRYRTESLVTRDIIPSLSIEIVTRVSFKSVPPIFFYRFWRVDLWPKNFWPGSRFFYFFFIAHFAWACVCTFLSFHFVHQDCLFNNSFISKWISMKLAPEFHLSILYKATNFQLQTTKCRKFRVPFTLHIGTYNNLKLYRMNCMKLKTYILHVCLHLWEKFEEIMTLECSRRDLSILLQMNLQRKYILTVTYITYIINW